VNRQTDQQLLRQYGEHRSEPAFAELVQRHVDFVYSTALRLVCDPHLAEDVTQNVFIALGRNALQLTEHRALSGWLHLTTRNLAANVVRTDVRRREREQEAANMNELLAKGTCADWDEIAPQLDAALGELNEPDREALLLRYFEQKSAQEMAEVLGVSDEAAQKRVTRAIDRLRDVFTKRGVTVGASGFAVALSANAVQAAPAGLALTISTTAGLAATTTVATTTAKLIAMTAMQKSVVAAALTIAVGAGIYEARQAAVLQTQVQSLRQQQAPLLAQIQDLKSRLGDGANTLALLKQENQQLRLSAADLPRLRGEIDRMRRDVKDLAAKSSAGTDPFVQKALKWKANEARLRQLFDERPNQRIPEMRLLAEENWLDFARDDDLESEGGIRRALSNVRRIAQNQFANLLSDALARFVQKNKGRLPDNMAQLKSYFAEPVDDDMLTNYRLQLKGTVADIPRGQWAVTSSVVDPEYDTVWGINPGGFGPMHDPGDDLARLRTELDPVLSEFSAANNGESPTEYKQLIPYLHNSAQSNAVDQLEFAGDYPGRK
jgi:RNA polymerase sigma factor (sigma-70 family)